MTTTCAGAVHTASNLAWVHTILMGMNAGKSSMFSCRETLGDQEQVLLAALEVSRNNLARLQVRSNEIMI